MNDQMLLEDVWKYSQGHHRHTPKTNIVKTATTLLLLYPCSKQGPIMLKWIFLDKKCYLVCQIDWLDLSFHVIIILAYNPRTHLCFGMTDWVRREFLMCQKQMSKFSDQNFYLYTFGKKFGPYLHFACVTLEKWNL